MIILCQGDLNEQTEKLVRLLINLYHRELLKQRQSLDTFCAQSIIQGLILHSRPTQYTICYGEHVKYSAETTQIYIKSTASENMLMYSYTL